MNLTDQEFQWLAIATKRARKTMEGIAGGKAIGKKANPAILTTPGYQTARELDNQFKYLKDFEDFQMTEVYKVFLHGLTINAIKFTTERVMPELNNRLVKDSKYQKQMKECLALKELLKGLEKKLQ